MDPFKSVCKHCGREVILDDVAANVVISADFKELVHKDCHIRMSQRVKDLVPIVGRARASKAALVNPLRN